MNDLTFERICKKAKEYGLGNIFAANMTDRGLISLLNKELIRISVKT